jgi:hypothetical protein
MIGRLSLLCGFLYAAACAVLLGLASNWFRYGLPLEAIAIEAAMLGTGIIVLAALIVSYRMNSLRALAASVAITLGSLAFTIHVYGRMMHEYPYLYLNHVVAGPASTLQTKRGPVRYWIELYNCLYKGHEEYLVVEDGKKRWIKVAIFPSPVGTLNDSKEPDDWAVLRASEEPDIAILASGRSFIGVKKRFRVDLSAGVASLLEDVQEGRSFRP